MWRIILNESEKRNTAEQLPFRLKNININIHLGYKVEAFSSYFLKLIDSLKTENMDINSAKLFLKSSFPEGFPVMLTIPTTEAELIDTVTALNSKNSFGYGGL